MRVVSLDCGFPESISDEWAFSSSASLLDYDIAFWDPTASLVHYTEYADSYQGRKSLNEHRSARLLRDATRRQAEFAEFLRLGRTIVVFLPGDIGVFVDTGERRQTGTGRNQQTTRMVQNVDLFEAATPIHVSRTPGSGYEIAAASEVMSGLLRRTEGLWNYRCVLEPREGMHPLAYVKGTSKIVGGMIRSSATTGLLLLLPDAVWWGDDEDEVPEGDDEEDDTNFRAVADSVRSLAGPEAEAPPDWMGRFRFATEVERSRERQDLEDSISELMQRRDTLRAAQAIDDAWKVLVYGTGDALERQVERAFELLGFTIEERVPGRTDLRASLGERLAVVEVKGVGRSAGERNAAQLEKWVATEQADGRAAKGILLANTWRETPLEERGESFPHQMLEYSGQRGHCLITGLQLLAMVRACLADPARATECAELLMATIDPLDGWDDLAVVFDSPVSSVEVGSDNDSSDDR